MLTQVPTDRLANQPTPGLMSVVPDILHTTTNGHDDRAEPIAVDEDKHARLNGLIAEINAGMADVESHTSVNLEKHRRVGEALFEAKALLKSGKFKPVGGWRGWTHSMKWSTRWCDYLIRLHVEWDDVQAAVEWRRKKNGDAVDGVCGALKALADHKRENETDDEKEQREEKEAARTQGKGTKRARLIAAARFIAAVLAGKAPPVDDVQVGEFVRETLEDQPEEPEESVTEKPASHSTAKHTRKQKAPKVAA